MDQFQAAAEGAGGWFVLLVAQRGWCELPRIERRITMSYIMATLTIRLPAQLRRDLERLSRRRHRPTGELVRESLRRYLAVERFRALREQVLPFAEAQGLLTDEDVFEAIS